jgi:protein-disulfide isomerase
MNSRRNIWKSVCAKNRFGYSKTQQIFRVMAVGFAFVSLLPLASSQKTDSPQSAKPLAVISGQPIDESQIPPTAKTQLQRMEEEVFAVRRRALQMVLDQKLLEAEAKKKGLSVENLIKTEVDAKVPEPTDQQLHDYYDQNKQHINKSFEDAESDVRLQVKSAEIQKARQLYIQGLLERAIDNGELTIMMRPPWLQLPPDPGRLRGNPKAPVTILEFSDFTCTACQKAESTISEILAKYPDKVKVGYRDFPFEAIRPGALLSAEASRCAGEQGKFWELHDLLFANPTRQTHEDLVNYARSLKLDDKQFEACLSSGRFEDRVEQDLQMGFHAGVVSPPSFFINGIFIEGDQPISAFEKIIDEELAGKQ